MVGNVLQLKRYILQYSIISNDVTNVQQLFALNCLVILYQTATKMNSYNNAHFISSELI